ncbi:hypothetical protein JXA47_09310, partial [Candidatus Sumerlaeota bacterium]|nr:hypothetical protein [Candidatus Sumerlaeota bacterium]
GGSDDIQTLPIGGGSLSVLVDNTTLLAFTGATGFGAAGSSAQAGNGDLLVMDASEFGGGGDLLRITPTGALSVEVPASQLGPYESSQGGGGIDEIAADSLGNIYVFSEDAEPPDGGILIILAQGGSTIIDYSVIETVTGGNLFEVEGQVGVYEANDQVMLYLCDDQSPRSIVRLTFDTTQATAADDWALYR